MKTIPKATGRSGSGCRFCRKLVAWTLGTSMALAATAAELGKTFATPDEAVSALSSAVKLADGSQLREIFGPAAQEFQNADRVQATNEFQAFSTGLDAGHRWVSVSPTQQVLEVGANHWPFPIPLVLRDGRWIFDTVAGKEEVLNRRIGQNELAVLRTMRTYVEGQREYASRDRDGDEVLEFAQRLTSSPGSKDGLYWPLDLDGEMSPMGPFVAQAQALGYALGSKAETQAPSAFHGYYFKILLRQGRHAPGGKYDYVINGNMIGGFALLAWPAAYGESGIMTFIVNQQGRVYQKDLGEKTAKLAAAIKSYDPDPTWVISPE